MNDIVTQVLEQTAREAEKYKPTTVEKHLELELDLGTLLARDNNDLDLLALRTKKDTYLRNLTRDNTQILLNALWQLPTERIDEAIVAKLPAPTFILPRAQRIPKPRAQTKWEKFAQDKGIQKKKKSKLSWDAELQKWVPLYGFRRADSVKQKDWVIEVPQNADPNKDMFAEKAVAKTERVAKNELQRLRNIAKQKGVKVPRAGITSSDKLNANQLTTAVTVARSSTASIGKFQPRLPKEKDARTRGVAEITPGVGRKRKAPHLTPGAEKEKHLATINALLNKRPLIDVEKAVNKQIYQEQQQRSEEKSERKPKKGGRGGKKGRGAAKPAAGKGQRNPSKRTVGRKRR